MFQKGDSVVYGNLGVCKINDLVTRQFEGLNEAHPYYVLKSLYQEGVLYVPADNPKIALRAVLTADEANQFIDSIPSLHGEAFHSRSAQELAAHYEESLKTHDCKDLLELAMSIYEKKQSLTRQNKKFGRVDEHFMRQAEENLYGELAAALNIPKESVPDYIQQRINAHTTA